MNRFSSRLRLLIEESVRRNLCEGILLSGGLDTSILAALASKSVRLRGYTVALKNVEAPDLKYSRLIAERFNIVHRVHEFDYDELKIGLGEVIKILKTFDPMEIRNSVAVYIALKHACEEGVEALFTGDGADELFAGYSFIYTLELNKIRLALKQIWRTMKFSSIPIARYLGIEARLPYLYSKLVKFAMKISPRYLVGKHNHDLYGKFILRRSFEALLPEEVIWRVKTPIEYGCGTTTVPKLFDKLINEHEFQEKRVKILEEDHVRIRDKEHLRYYELYRDSFGPPRPQDLAKRLCPACTSNISEETSFCTVCGAYPV